MFHLIDVIKDNTPVHRPTIMGEPTEPWVFPTREAAFQGAGVLGYEHTFNDCFLPKDGQYKRTRPIWLKLKEIPK